MKIKNVNKKFFNFWAYSYDYFILKPWLLYVQKKVVSYINLRVNIKILDVGCGTGDTLVIISKLSTAKLYGLDISKNMLLRARKKLGRKAKLILGDVEKIPFEDNYFDYVLNTEAFHHFPNPNKSLKEINRVLKKDGKFILADLNFYSDFIHWLFKKIEPGHVKIYGENEFKELFIKNYLEIIDQKRLGIFAILTIGKKIKNY